ncbi:hypothetical protein BG000_005282 [Podila horticola]|nr:hypothetical protein BG000_005282 [Podila horticola]
MTKGHSARKKHSPKHNVSIAHPDVVAKQDTPSSSSLTTTATTTTRITTTSQKTSASLGSLKQRSSVATLLNEGLEDLDHDLNEDLGGSQEQHTSTQSNKRSKHPSQQGSSSTASNSSSSSTATINHHVSFRNWLTASRVASNLQLLEEQREERYHYMERRKRYASSKLRGKKEHNQEPGPSDETESEKRLAKHTWDLAKVYRAYDLTSTDWTVLGALTILSLSVRLWRINAPDQVILGEGHMGNYVNSYLKSEYSFDVHPPLGKLLLTHIAKWSKYDGSHAFDGGRTMRALTAVMGALVAPIAFLTLKSRGQSASTAMMAALLITLDNALTTHNRLVTLDSPLLFFSALSILSWSMFSKQSPRWWFWLLMAGVAMGGAISTKLSGALTAGTVLLSAVFNMSRLAGDESVNAVRWVQHLFVRVGALVVMPFTIYLALFHFHFSLQINQPDPSYSFRADYDLNMLSLSYRNSLMPLANAPKDDMMVWRDVAYGSVIQLTSEASPHMHLHSIPDVLPYVLSSGQQQVAGYAHSDLNTHWLVTLAETTPEEPSELPLRLQYLKNGDMLKLRHLTSRRVLHSHDVRPHCCPIDKLMSEVSAYNASDANDNWIVEVVEPNGDGIVDESNKVPIIALESTIRLRHENQDCHLYVRNNMLAPEEGWGYGRQEIICLKETKATAHRTMWRITHNVHDFLPLDSELNSYPKLSFWQKLKESHSMMWTQLRAVETQETPAAGVSSKPWQWLLAQVMLLAWVGEQGQQIVITANSVVWWTSTLGLVVFVIASALFALRQQRGYLERGHAAALKNYHLRDAGVYFAGWAINFIPFLFLTKPRARVLHHYFPALYFAILVACSVFSGITAFLPRGARLTLHIGFIALVAGMFARLTPITYGSPMDASQCRSLDQWLAKTITLGQPTSFFLDCSFDSSNEKSASVPVPRVGKAIPVAKRPVLKAHYHHPDFELPYQDAYYLMPFQRPPQQWTKLQKAKPDVHQIQMLKGRMGQDFDWTTHTEDRMNFQTWIEQDGMDPWKDQRRAEEERVKRKSEDEEGQRVLMANHRIERRHIKAEKRRLEEEQQRTEEEQRLKEEEQEHMEEEQRQATEASIVAAPSQEAQNLNEERIETEFLGAKEEFCLALKKDHEEPHNAREGQEESEEDKNMSERIQNLLSTKTAEAALECSSGNEEGQIVDQAPIVEQEKEQENQVEEHHAEQIPKEKERIQEPTKLIEAHQDVAALSPSERAKGAYLDTVIANAHHLANHNKPDAPVPSDSDFPVAQQPDEAPKPSNEAKIAQFRNQEAALRAQGEKTVKQQLREQQEQAMSNKVREQKERQRLQKALRHGLKDLQNDQSPVPGQVPGVQGRRPPTPKMFRKPGAPSEDGDFPLVGSGLSGIGLGALEEMDSEQLEPVRSLVEGMIEQWTNQMIESIKSGELKMIQDETGARWVDMSEKKVERAPLAQAQGLDRDQSQGHAKKSMTDPVAAKKPKVGLTPKKAKVPGAKTKPNMDPSEQAPKVKAKKPKVKAKKPKAAPAVPVKPQAPEAKAQAQTLEDARKESANTIEKVQAMRKASEGKSNAFLGFVPGIDGKDDEKKLRLLQDAFKELLEGI